MTPQIKKLYSCVCCPKSFDSLQALRGHMNKHKDVEFKDFHVRLPKAEVESFEKVCERHKTTTCSLIFALMQAAVKGEETGIVDVSTANPLIVQVNHFFAALPRGHGKYDVAAMVDGLSEHLLQPLLDVRSKNWPPSCKHANEFFKSSREVGCLKIREIRSLSACWACFLRGENR